MYSLHMPILDNSDKETLIAKKLLKDILGYTNEEVHQFATTMFMCCVAKNLSIEQVKLIVKPFNYDNGINMYLKKDGKIISYIEAGINLTKEPPKDHYYDHPVVSRDQLVDPWTQKEKERYENYARQEREERIAKATPVKVTCPYCKSTDCKKITNTSKAVHTAIFGIFSLGRNSKQWHCNSCKSDF